MVACTKDKPVGIQSVVPNSAGIEVWNESEMKE
jgi:hypothetical protein